MKKTVWAMVADEAIARILQKSDSGDTFEPVHELTHPAAHARAGDLRDDAQGRRAAGTPTGVAGAGQHGHTIGANVTSSAGDSEKHLEAYAFARQVSEWLQQALHAKRFDELHVAAAPRFLGILRKVMPAELARHVVQEVNKDWVQVDNTELVERFFG